MQNWSIRRFTVNLTDAHINFELSPGLANTIYIENAGDINAKLTVRIDSTGGVEPLPLSTGMIVRFKNETFSRMFFNNDAVSTAANEAIIWVCTNVELEMLERITSNMAQSGVKSEAVSVADTATPLPSTSLDNRVSMVIQVPAGGSTVYLGGSDVSITNGLSVTGGSSFSLDIAPGATLYGIVASGTQDVIILQGA